MQAFDEFLEILRLDNRLVDDLLGVLAQETQLLSTRQFQQLDTLSQKKQDLSNQLESNYQCRLKLLQQLGNDSDPKVLQQLFLEQCSPEQASQIKQLNAELESNLSNCRHNNLVNGQVIAVNLSNQQAIYNILQGKSTTATTYSPTGQVNNQSSTTKHEEI